MSENPTEGVLATYIEVDDDRAEWVPWPFVPAVSTTEHERRTADLVVERDALAILVSDLAARAENAERDRDALLSEMLDAAMPLRQTMTTADRDGRVWRITAFVVQPAGHALAVAEKVLPDA